MQVRLTLNVWCSCSQLLSAGIPYLHLHSQFMFCGYWVQGFLDACVPRALLVWVHSPAPGKMFYTSDFHYQLHFYDDVNWSQESTFCFLNFFFLLDGVSNPGQPQTLMKLRLALDFWASWFQHLNQWNSKDSLRESVLSLHLAASEDHTQAIRLDDKFLYPLRHLLPQEIVPSSWTSFSLNELIKFKLYS